MTETFITLTEDEFEQQYILLTNNLNPTAGWGYGDSNGCLFETYGQELAFVTAADPNRVWTLVDGDDGDMYLVSGLHFVNRVGYLISHAPIPENTSIDVRLEMQPDGEGSP